jgi:hypothetical protein
MDLITLNLKPILKNMISLMLKVSSKNSLPPSTLGLITLSINTQNQHQVPTKLITLIIPHTQRAILLQILQIYHPTQHKSNNYHRKVKQ